MKLLAPSRDEVSRLVGAPCLLAADRQRRALFISDFPRRLGAEKTARVRGRLEAEGFPCHVENGLARIDWSPARYLGFFRALGSPPLPAAPDGCDFPLWGLCRLLRQHDTPLEAQPAACLRDALLLLDAGQAGQLARLGREWLALALRFRTGVPCAVADLLICRGLTGP